MSGWTAKETEEYLFYFYGKAVKVIEDLPETRTVMSPGL